MEKIAKLSDLIQILAKLKIRDYSSMADDDFNGWTAELYNPGHVILFHNNSVDGGSLERKDWDKILIDNTMYENKFHYPRTIAKKLIYHRDLIVAFDEMFRAKPEWVVYSASHKVSQYFLDATVNEVIAAFEQQLKTKISITDFTILDATTGKKLTVTPKVQAIEYVVE